jgi:phasin family protein
MNTNILSSLNNQSVQMLSSLQKLNKLAVADVEKLADNRIASLKSVSDLYIDNLKAAANVHDLKGLQAFMFNQSHLAMTMAQRLASDTKEVAQMGMGFVTEAQKVAQAGVTTPAPR